ncbi:MAG TPA: LPS export ABC transporter periplasmic protein LptC [Myxococcota bacterium]|nr:LPS export ABC transporter periplasmic protein LptC [Myxococcota bacterium]
MHARRSRRPGRAARIAGAASLLCAAAATAPAADEPAASPVPGVASEVLVTGMVFVVSRAADGDLVLESREATLHPDSQRVELRDARVRATDPEQRRRFDVRADRGELDLVSYDFLAEGDVHGSTQDGQRYSAPWVRYRRADALLYTDAPVLLQDGSGRLRGDGFRYHLRERRFEITGNVSVVQEP